MDGAGAVKAADRLGAGEKADSIAFDVTDPRAVDGCRPNRQTPWQGRCAGHSAGIAISFKPAETMDDVTWNKVIDVNLNGVFWCCRAFGKHMLERGDGADCQCGVDLSADRQLPSGASELQCIQSRRASSDTITRSGMGGAGFAGELRGTTYIETHLTRTRRPDRDIRKHWIDGTPMGRMGQPQNRSGHFVPCQ